MKRQYSAAQWLHLLVPSILGIVMFFVPIQIGDKNTILLDHLVIGAEKLLADYASWYALALVLGGAIYPFYTKFWRQGVGACIFAAFKIAGIFLAAMVMTKSGPAILYEPFMLEFLWKALVIPVAILVPIGAIFMPLLVNYGLVELVGVLSQPLMRVLFKIPGRAAIDAVASFVTSFAVGLLITNKAYLSGEYSAKEAAIIATGFSTVSVAFMVIVARTLGLMDMWLVFFVATLLTTVIVTAISARLPPIARLDDTVTRPERVAVKGERFAVALDEAMAVANMPKRFSQLLLETMKDGLLMTMTILPTILSIGTLGLLVEKYTPVFDYVGYLFYPIALIFGLDNPLELSAAIATSYPEMFLPALIMAKADLVSRITAGIVAISSILFVAASIPCIMATKIPLSFVQLSLIWAVRAALSMLVAIPMAMLIAQVF